MSKVGKALFLIALIAGIIFIPCLSGADKFDKNVHYFQPPTDGSGVVLTYGSEPLNWLGIHYGVYADESIGHLTYRIPDTDDEIIIFRNQTGLNALLAVGISKYLNAGVAFGYVPYREFNKEFEEFYNKYYSEEGEGGEIGELKGFEESSMEDLRVDVKGILFDRRNACIGLAGNLTITIPVGLEENSFLSDQTPTFAPRLIVDMGRHWWSVALNAAYKIYGKEVESDFLDMVVKDEIIFGLGGKFRFLSSNELMVDTIFRTHAADFFSDPNEDYGEVIGAYRYVFGSYSLVAITIGGGMGIMEGAGTPSSRFFLGITSYEYRLGF